MAASVEATVSRLWIKKKTTTKKTKKQKQTKKYSNIYIQT